MVTVFAGITLKKILCVFIQGNKKPNLYIQNHSQDTRKKERKKKGKRETRKLIFFPSYFCEYSQWDYFV